MIGVALKGLAGRKIRALLTAFAIVIGVSMVAGTFILTDTTQQSGLELDDGSTATTDAAIFEKELVKGSTSGTHASMPVSMLAKVRALPGVADASGEVSPQKELHAADVIGRDGKVVATHSIARGVDPAKLNISATTAGAWGPLKLESGAWAKGPRQVVIDRHTAAARHYAIGDPIVISTLGTRHTFRIAGTVSFLAENLPPIPTLAVWDSVPFFPAGVVTSILPSLFGMVNTMVLSVFERTREIGMLRTIGMTRRQARRMIRHESVITALIGATLGLGLGLFLAVLGTQAMPDIATMTIPWLALAGFSLVAVVAGVGAAVLPARRASRLNVLEAVSYE